jgi:hypothetical protein
MTFPWPQNKKPIQAICIRGHKKVKRDDGRMVCKECTKLNRKKTRK